MSKAHRGTGVRKEPNHGRGKCPLCGKDGVKLLYAHEKDGNKVKICKICNAALKNKAKVEARAAKKVAVTESADAPAEA